MNLILLFKDDFIDSNGRVRLEGRRHEHVRNVHRAFIGDELRVGLCDERIGTGKIVSLDDNALEMDVIFSCDAPKALAVTLVLALPRPNMCKRILACASSMGVKHIILFHSSRVEKSFWRSPVLEEERIKDQLILGLEQARDTILPQVQLRPAFKPFVEDELSAMAENTLKFVAHPESSESCPNGVDQPVTLVIGPEGGFIPYEIESLTALGFAPVHLGERILRVESVVPALLSRLLK